MKAAMRLPPNPPEDLSPHLRDLHDAIAARMGSSLSGFISQDEAGGLIGPFPPLLHYPVFGEPAFRYLDAVAASARLPKPVREIAILVVGARFKARYELYSHERMAHLALLSESKIAAVAAGQRPADLSETEGAAYDLAVATLAGSVPDTTYGQALRLFGREGVGELAFLVGAYALICTLLNTFDAPVPGDG